MLFVFICWFGGFLWPFIGRGLTRDGLAEDVNLESRPPHYYCIKAKTGGKDAETVTDRYERSDGNIKRFT